MARLATGRQVILKGAIERPTIAVGLRIQGECEVVSPGELLAHLSDLGIGQWIE